MDTFKKRQSYSRKVFFAIFIFLLNTLPAISQKSEPKFSAEVLFGASFPVGKFGDKTVYQDTGSTVPGWAKTGPALQVSLNYQINQTYGLSLVLSGQQNYQDANSISKAFELHYSPNDSTSFQSNSKGWKIGKILFGGFLTLPIKKQGKLFLQPRLLAGILKTSLPGYSVSVYRMTYGAIYPIEYMSSTPISLNWAFCYQAEMMLGYKLNSIIYLTADLSYFHASPSRSYTIYSFGNPSSVSSKDYKTQYPISALNLMIGAGIRF